MQPSSQWRPMHNKGKQFENQFFIYKPKCKKNVYFGLSSHPYPCTCQIRKQSDKKFLSLNPKYEKNIDFFSYLGGSWGPLCRTQVNENFRAVRPHHRADICITRGKITASFSYMGHNIQKCAFWAIRGALGGP